MPSVPLWPQVHQIQGKVYLCHCREHMRGGYIDDTHTAHHTRCHPGTGRAQTGLSDSNEYTGSCHVVCIWPLDHRYTLQLCYIKVLKSGLIVYCFIMNYTQTVTLDDTHLSSGGSCGAGERAQLIWAPQGHSQATGNGSGPLKAGREGLPQSSLTWLGPHCLLS